MHAGTFCACLTLSNFDNGCDATEFLYARQNWQKCAVVSLRENTRGTCDYKKVRLKRGRTCRDALWSHVHPQGGIKFICSKRLGLFWSLIEHRVKCTLASLLTWNCTDCNIVVWSRETHQGPGFDSWPLRAHCFGTSFLPLYLPPLSLPLWPSD